MTIEELQSLALGCAMFYREIKSLPPMTVYLAGKTRNTRGKVQVAYKPDLKCRFWATPKQLQKVEGSLDV